MCRLFVMRGCIVSRRYINVCNSDVFCVVNVYLDHLKLCYIFLGTLLGYYARSRLERKKTCFYILNNE